MAGTAKEGYDKLTPAVVATLTAEADGWQPNDGDELDGTVLAIKSAFSDVKQAHYPIVFVLTEDGNCVAVHCFQTVIENEMKSARPMPGERIYIKRIGAIGEAKKAGQSPPIRYAVHVQREAGTDDPWSRM